VAAAGNNAESRSADGNNSSSSSWLECCLLCSIDSLDRVTDQGLSHCCLALGHTQQQQEPVPQLLLSAGRLQVLLFVLQPRLLGLSSQGPSSQCAVGPSTCGAALPPGWLEGYLR